MWIPFAAWRMAKNCEEQRELPMYGSISKFTSFVSHGGWQRIAKNKENCQCIDLLQNSQVLYQFYTSFLLALPSVGVSGLYYVYLAFHYLVRYGIFLGFP
jgi:hypothetical protein